jgi:predicted ATPase/class 3 adenylate cyclase
MTETARAELEHEGVEYCWDDADTIVYCRQGTSSWPTALIRAPKQRFPNSATTAKLSRDYEAAKLLPPDIIVKPLALEQCGNARAVILEDSGARPVNIPPPAEEAALGGIIEMATWTIESLDKLHARGMVHGNLTANNIWHRPDQKAVRLFDFSCTVEASNLVTDLSVRQNADLRYAAPETLAAAPFTPDHRSDYYSFGVVFYRWLTGRLPFDHADPVQILHAQLACPPSLPAEVASLIPDHLSVIVLKLLAKSAQDRYQTAAQLDADLRGSLQALCAPRNASFKQHRETTTIQFPIGFYGRQRDISALARSFELASTGCKQAVFLSGAPGIGKSALISTLRQTVADKHGFFIIGKFDQYKRDIPYAAAVQAFQQLVSVLLCGSEGQLLQWRARLAEVLGANGRVIADVIPEIEHIIGPQAALPELPPLESRNRFYMVFRDFLRVFATADHPLCVVMDDLQWADAASLSLIESLLTDSTIAHAMLLGAYRSTEVTESDATMLTIRTLERAGIRVEIIVLGGLEAHQINEFLADTLHCAPSACRELATHIALKTDGNPFFVRQLLHAFLQDNFITFDRSRAEWTWDMARIRTSGFTNDIVELMRSKFSQLSEDLRPALMVAACLGSSFTLARLRQAMGSDSEAAVNSINSAIDAGFLSELDELAATEKGYKFVHDRVQQAAHDLIPEAAQFRLDIGRRLRDSITSRAAAAVPFDIVDNLNYGWHLMPATEQLGLARLNLIAGRKARESLAYHEALKYLRLANRLLPPLIWTDEHELAFDVHSECFECEYQTGHVREADSLFDILLDHATSKTEIATIYRTKILLNTSDGRYEEAVRIAVDALARLGIRFPRNTSTRHLIAEILTAKALMLGKSISDIAALPAMVDPDSRAIMRILTAIGPTAYFVNLNTFMLNGLKLLTTSLKCGNAPESPMGYVFFALAQVAAGKIPSAYAFGKLAAEMSHVSADLSVRAQTLVVYGGFVQIWHDPIDLSIETLREAHKHAMSSGNFQYCGYAVLQIVFLSLARGLRLDAVVAECNRFSTFIEETKDVFAVDGLNTWRQAARALKGETNAEISLDSDIFEEAAVEHRLRRQKNLTSLGYFLIRKLQLAYLFGEYDAAFAYGSEAERFVSLLPGQIHVVEHSLYFGLTLVAILRRTHGRKWRLERALKRCKSRLARWADFAPQNFEHMSLLLSAETVSLRSAGLGILQQYDRAVETARESGFVHIEALASERAAHCCLKQGNIRIAQAYLLDAIDAYTRWGAMAKVRQLEEAATKQNILLPVPKSEHETVPRFHRPPQVALDLSAVHKASIALSAVSELDELLAKLMSVALEIAHAERGAIVLRELGRLYIRVVADDLRTGPRVTHAPLEGTPHASPAVVNFCIHTELDIVFQQATADERFQSCDYIRLRRPQSVLCVPLVKQGDVLGALYLENNLLANAFDVGRLHMLHLIMRGGALSIENARIYSQLRHDHRALQDAVKKAELLEQTKMHLEKFVARPVQRLINENPLSPDLDISERDLSIMFLDLERYTWICEQLSPKKRKSLIERYFSSFLELIHRHGGDINFLEGDGTMAIFQDAKMNAIHAADAALAIRERAAALNRDLTGEYPQVIVNIGINSGRASVGPEKIESTGGALYTYTAAGPTANVAARICQFSTGGAILVSKATAHHLQRSFDLTFLGTHSFKNVSEPECIYRVEQKTFPVNRTPRPEG